MYTKEQKAMIKSDIKSKVELQKEYKRNRKTVKIVGDRTYEPWRAIFLHSINRSELHDLYVMYAIMRGKSEEWIKQHVDKSYQSADKYLKQILKKYGEAICVSQS